MVRLGRRTLRLTVTRLLPTEVVCHDQRFSRKTGMGPDGSRIVAYEPMSARTLPAPPIARGQSDEALQRRLERKARRENARRVADAPLFAHGGLVSLVNADDMRAQREAHKAAAAGSRESLKSFDRALREQAAALRQQVATRVSADDLAACDAYCKRTYPDDGAYLKLCWQARLDALQAGQPLLPVERRWEPAEEAASRARVRKLAAIWEAVHEAHPELVARAKKYDRRAWAELDRLKEEAEIAAGLPPRPREVEEFEEEPSPQLELLGGRR